MSFHFVYGSAVEKLITLVRSQLFIFGLISITLGGGSKKNLLLFMSKSILLMFSSGNFIISGLTFRSLVYFSLFLYMVLENVSGKCIFYFSCPVSQRHLLKRLSFLSVYSWLLYHRLIDQKCVLSFLGFLTCSIDLYF